MVTSEKIKRECISSSEEDRFIGIYCHRNEWKGNILSLIVRVGKIAFVKHEVNPQSRIFLIIK